MAITSIYAFVLETNFNSKYPYILRPWLIVYSKMKYMAADDKKEQEDKIYLKTQVKTFE